MQEQLLGERRHSGRHDGRVAPEPDQAACPGRGRHYCGHRVLPRGRGTGAPELLVDAEGCGRLRQEVAHATHRPPPHVHAVARHGSVIAPLA